MPTNNWAVFRQDFAGNEFLVEKNLSEDRAHELVIEYESHKHHQHYWARQLQDSPTDYTKMLRDSLSAGSTLDASLMVLRNQNASLIQCIKAVREVRGIDASSSKRIVLESPVFADHTEWRNQLLEQIESELNEET